MADARPCGYSYCGRCWRPTVLKCGRGPRAACKVYVEARILYVCINHIYVYIINIHVVGCNLYINSN